MKTKILLLAALALSTVCASAQNTTAFTFQGSLDSSGSPANGAYDLQLTLVDGSTNAIAGPVTNSVSVSNGLFSVQLDFGSAPFADGPRYLQLGVRTNGGTTFTILSPLQQITAAPFAITAINLTGPVAASNLSGTISVGNLPAGLVAAVITNNQSGVTLSGTFSGNGASLTNLPSAPAGILTNTQAGVSLTGTFSGNGAGLSNVAAASFSGFLPTSQLSGTIPAVQISGVLGSAQLPSSLVTNFTTNASLGGLFNGLFTGSGAGLTNINAANLVGVVSSNALTSVPAANLKGVISADNLPTNLTANLPADLITNGQTNVTLSGAFAGDGSLLTNISVALGVGVVTNGESGVTLSGAFSGSGSGLTGISASALTGNIPLAQLPTGFTGIVTNGETVANLGGAFSGTFTGNGGGLNSLNAGSLTGTLSSGVFGTTPIPAANLTGTIPAGVGFSGGLQASQLTGSIPEGAIPVPYTAPVNFSNPNNTFAGTINATINQTAIDVQHINNSGNLTNDGDIFITNNTPNAPVYLSVTNGAAGTGVGIDNLGNITSTDVPGTPSVLTLTNVNGLTGVKISSAGNITATGTITAGTITGNGSGLTSVPAASLTGSLNAASLSGAVPAGVTVPTGDLVGVLPAAALFGNVPAGTVTVPSADLTGNLPGGVGVPAASLSGTVPPGTVMVPSADLTGNLPGGVGVPAASLSGTVPSGTVTVPSADLTGNLPVGVGVADGSLPATYTQPVNFSSPGSTFAGTVTGTLATTSIDVQHINNSGNLTNDGDVFITNNAVTPVELSITNGSTTTGVGIDNAGHIVSTGGSIVLTNGTTTGVVMDLAGDIWNTGNLKVNGAITGNLTGNVTGNVTGNLTGTASMATTSATAASATSFTGNLVGDVTGTQGATVVTSIAGALVNGAPTPNNIPQRIVQRDNNGDFTAHAITAATGIHDAGTLVVDNGITDNGPVTAVESLTSANGITDNGAVTTVQGLIDIGSALITGITDNGTLSASGITDNGANTIVKTLNATSITNSGNIGNGGNLTNGGNIYITNSSSVSLSVTNAGTGVIVDNGGNLSASATVASPHHLGTGAKPGITAGPGAEDIGNDAVVTLDANASDSAGQITITTGAATDLDAVVCTVTYHAAFANSSYVVIFPANGNASDIGFLPFVTTSTTGFSLNTSASTFETSAAAPNNTYVYNYIVIGR